MKKKVLFILALIVLVCHSPSFSLANELTVYPGINNNLSCVKVFEKSHSDSKIVSFSGDSSVLSTSQLIGQLLTREFKSDIIILSSMDVDQHVLMSKGYFIDLSQNAAIKNAVDSMYPVFSEYVTKEQGIFAFPVSLKFDYWTLDKDVLDEINGTTENIPQDYDEFLDFVEKWCDFITDNDRSDMHIYSRINAIGNYDASSYVLLLVEPLLQEYISQFQLSGKPLDFNSIELKNALERTVCVCNRIFETESYLDPADYVQTSSLITEGNQMI